MRQRQLFAVVVIACLLPPAASAQAVPDVFPFGEFEVGLDVVAFDQKDIISLDSFTLDGLHALQINLSSRLDSAFVEATRGKTGYLGILRICGRKIVEARIQSEIDKAGILLTSGDLSVVQKAEDLLRRPPCSEL